VVPDKIQTHPKGGYWKFQGREDLESHSFFVLGGWGSSQKTSHGRLWIFSGTAHLLNMFSDQWISRTGKMSHTSTHCRKR